MLVKLKHLSKFMHANHHGICRFGTMFIIIWISSFKRSALCMIVVLLFVYIYIFFILSISVQRITACIVCFRWKCSFVRICSLCDLVRVPIFNQRYIVVEENAQHLNASQSIHQMHYDTHYTHIDHVEFGLNTETHTCIQRTILMLLLFYGNE